VIMLIRWRWRREVLRDYIRTLLCRVCRRSSRAIKHLVARRNCVLGVLLLGRMGAAMRPAQVSNPELLSAVKTINALTPEYRRALAKFEAAEAAYLALGNQENRNAFDAAKKRLDKIELLLRPERETRAREMRRYR